MELPECIDSLTRLSNFLLMTGTLYEKTHEGQEATLMAKYVCAIAEAIPILEKYMEKGAAEGGEVMIEYKSLNNQFCGCCMTYPRCKEDCYWYGEWQDMGAHVPYCKCKSADFIEPKDCENCEQYHSKRKPTNATDIG